MVTTCSAGRTAAARGTARRREKLSGSSRSRPLGLEVAQATRDGQAVPVVDDVEQVAAGRAGEVRLVDGEGRPAGRVDALLVRSLGRDVESA